MDPLESSESTAGNFRLSATNSLHRLRVPVPHLHLAKDYTHVPQASPQDQSFFDIASLLRHNLFPGPVLPLPNRHLHACPWWMLCLKWMLLTYCFLSFIVFSVDLYTHAPLGGVGNPSNTINASSAFDDSSTGQRLSRFFSLQRTPLDFDPFIIRSDEGVDDSSVTACIWASELQDFDVLRSWASHWQGPISFLMTTAAKSNSRPQAELLRRLNDLKTASLPGLSIHLLHVDNHYQSSNTYLNLARYFAPTSTVMLVPANLSEPPAISHKAIRSRKLYSYSQHPLIVTSTAQNWSTVSAIPALPPIIIQRNHPVWCTERSFLRKTRNSDWGACLWQFWLDSFGEFVDVGARSVMKNRPSLAQASNDRLSVRFRAEACDLVARTMGTLGLKEYKNGKKNLQWLKDACGQFPVDKMFKNIEK